MASARDLSSWMDEIGLTAEGIDPEALPVEAYAFLRSARKVQSLQKACKAAVIEDTERKKSEYRAAARSLEEKLSAIGIEDDDDASLAKVAAVIGADSASPSHVLVALSELLERYSKLQIQLSARKLNIERLDEAIRSTLQRARKVQETKERLEAEKEHVSQDVQERRRHIETLLSKTIEYQHASSRDRTRILSSGVTTDLTHASILIQSQKVVQIRDQVSKHTSRAEAYQHLPPDMTLARLRLDEKLQEAQLLETKVKALIGGIEL